MFAMLGATVTRLNGYSVIVWIRIFATHLHKTGGLNMQLQPDETEIQAFWIDLGSSVVPDYSWERINYLTKEYLKLLKRIDNGDTLYCDPTDGRVWELIYLHPHLSGGGPPLLRLVPPELANEKYGLSAL